LKPAKRKGSTPPRNRSGKDPAHRSHRRPAGKPHLPALIDFRADIRSTKSIVVVTGSPVILFNNWYGALFVLANAGSSGNRSESARIACFLVNASAFRQNHDWCTNAHAPGPLVQ